MGTSLELLQQTAILAQRFPNDRRQTTTGIGSIGGGIGGIGGISGGVGSNSNGYGYIGSSSYAA